MTNLYQAPPSVLLVVGEEDKNYLPRLQPALGGARCKVFTGEIVTATEISQLARRHGFTSVATTRVDLLKCLLPAGRERNANISNYSGSIIPQGDLEYLILDPLKQLVTVSYGDFLARRYMSKLVKRGNWNRTTEFKWEIVDDEFKFQQAKAWLAAQDTDFIAVDSETVKPNIIRCVGYCGMRVGQRESKCFVIPVTNFRAVEWMRELNWLHKPKVLQNGKYDCAYFAAWNAPLWGYYFDTVNAMHSWYSELPKDLASISVLLVRDAMYWKDLADTGDLFTYYKYNALDCWATAESWLAWLQEAPVWAKTNYVMEFSQVPPSHMCEMTGLKRDQEKLEAAAAQFESKQEGILKSLQNCIAPNFNPSSPQQVLKLIHALGYKKATDSKESTIQEASYVHPINELLLTKVLDYRGLRKLTSTYLTVGEKSKEFRGRILCSLNPHGTDTNRKSSKEHHFWCGLQLQNIPRDGEESGEVKATLVADEGFDLWEADFSQAEARGVAYKSGDLGLIEAVESPRDFHSVNASAFFGVPYEQIFRDAVAGYIDHETQLWVEPVESKTLDKKLRDLSKRTNHGANYNMGAAVMLQTMGSKKVREAQKLLKLSPALSLIEVCHHLLLVYERTYPRVKTTYYEKIKKDVKTTQLLVGDTGWTRYCFGKPWANKLDLNSYVAHVTQSLNAVLLDRAFLAVFLDLGFNPNFKLNMQIHDSILFQVRRGHEHLAHRVKELMTFSVPVTDCLGITRQMLVPVDLKKLGSNWRGHE